MPLAAAAWRAAARRVRSAHSRQTDSGITPSRISQPKTMQPTHTPASDSSAGKTTMIAPMRSTGRLVPASQKTVAAMVKTAPTAAAKRFGGPAV